MDWLGVKGEFIKTISAVIKDTKVKRDFILQELPPGAQPICTNDRCQHRGMTLIPVDVEEGDLDKEYWVCSCGMYYVTPRQPIFEEEELPSNIVTSGVHVSDITTEFGLFGKIPRYKGERY